MLSRLHKLEPKPRVAVIAVGSTEYHGEHLPLETDTLIATALAHSLARAYRLHLGPVFPVSCSHEHAAWEETRSISEEELRARVEGAIDELAGKGYSRFVLVNGHGGNYALRNLVQRLSEHEPRVTLFPMPEDWADAERAAGLATNGHDDMHAGEREVSQLLHWYPHLVDVAKLPPDHLVPDRRFLHVLGMKFYAPHGYIGRPGLGTAAKGARLEQAFVRLFADHLLHLTGQPARLTTAPRVRPRRPAQPASPTRHRGSA